jgi:hypothetical protein
MRMACWKKIFETGSRKNGVESEFVDLCKRARSTMLAKHSYRPNFDDEVIKIRTGLNWLEREIAQ